MLWKGFGDMVPSHDFDDAGCVKNVPSFLVCEQPKAIARKKRPLNPFVSVLPLAHPCSHWKEALDSPTHQLISDDFFTVRLCPNGIPPKLVQLEHGRVGSSAPPYSLCDPVIAANFV